MGTRKGHAFVVQTGLESGSLPLGTRCFLAKCSILAKPILNTYVSLGMVTWQGSLARISLTLLLAPKYLCSRLVF
jgi:hypothetical protein